MACSRPLGYAKVTPFFFDALEWFANGTSFDVMVNVESDMVFTGSNLGAYYKRILDGYDYVVPRFVRNVKPLSKWRPFRSLKAELPELASILGRRDFNGGFSPGQVFTRRYAETILQAKPYQQIRDFVERNQAPTCSYTLQEVLLPTLGDMWGLRARDYPAVDIRFNRYRPYHSVNSYRSAIAHGAPLIHPIRRDLTDRARAEMARDLFEARLLKEDVAPAGGS
jgi:hypothetical protein